MLWEEWDGKIGGTATLVTRMAKEADWKRWGMGQESN